VADVDSAVPERKRVRGRKSAAPAKLVSPSEAEFDTPDPIEIAMKAVAAGAVPGSAAQIVLEKHAHLIDVQCRREREELGNVRVQRITRWLILGAVAALLIGFAAMLFNASQSRALVIDTFDVPPSLQQRGITGKVVGARLLDRLSQLQRQTESSRAESSYANNWEDQIQVAVPEAGVSLGEVWRTLRRWLGEETRIGGEVVQTSRGLAITTRAGSLSGGTVEGPEADFNRLLDEAAAAIYRATQPYRYAISLPPEGDVEREQVLLSLVDHPDELERKWAYSGLSVTYRNRGDYRRAIAMAHQALAIDRQMVTAWANIGLARMVLGHDEQTIAAFEETDRIERRGLPSEYDAGVSASNRASGLSWIAWRKGDGLESMRQAETMLRGTSRNFRLTGLGSALSALALMHDHQGVVDLVGRADFTADEAARYDWYGVRAGMLLARAADFNDPTLARRAAEGLLASTDRTLAQALPSQRGFGDAYRQREVWPYVALALARTGHADRAAALAAQTPPDCYDCALARAVAAAAQRNRPEAERWFREAIRQGPSIPVANYEWGLMLAGQGELARAEGHFQRAHEIGPRWADPLKAWGDLLVERGEWAEAEQRYRSASRLAPKWGALHLAWARALWRLGRQDEARQTLAAARTMALSPAEGAWLRNMIRRAGI
jgi:tetratricopeptide (TPR) repeat protein